jgi:hypothetical protein
MTATPAFDYRWQVAWQLDELGLEIVLEIIEFAFKPFCHLQDMFALCRVPTYAIRRMAFSSIQTPS